MYRPAFIVHVSLHPTLTSPTHDRAVDGGDPNLGHIIANPTSMQGQMSHTKFTMHRFTVTLSPTRSHGF